MKARAMACAAAAAALSFFIAGCSGSGSSPTAASTTGSGSGSGATAGSGSGSGSGSGTGTGSGGSSGAASPGGSSGQLTGAQLTKALLPAADFPHSFAASTQGSADSGTSLEKTSAVYNLSTLSCTDWDNYFTGAGFGETAYSSGSVASNAEDQSYGQLVYQFASPAAATRFFSGVQALSARCRSFNASGGGSAGRITMALAAASTVAGHKTFWIDQATTVTGTSSKIDTLFALDGTDVLAISASGVGAAPPSDPAPSVLLAELITRVEARR